MAANPLVAQGTLNRLRGSVVVTQIPQLNVTAPFLGREGISLGLEGNTTTYIDTMTGAVTSPEPYQRATVKVHLLKTQSLSALYKAQMELISTIGDIVVTPDTLSLPTYSFTNCSIMSIDELTFNGENAGFTINLGGVYYINSALWNLV